MNAAERLDQIEARANAATKGPWEFGTCDGGCCNWADTESGAQVFGADTPETADFIVHARTDVPALVAALRAVLDLHAPDEPYCSDDNHNPYQCPCATVGCRECERDYPCPTVTAIEEALG